MWMARFVCQPHSTHTPLLRKQEAFFSFSKKRILPDQNADKSKWIFIMLKCSFFLFCSHSFHPTDLNLNQDEKFGDVLALMVDGGLDALYCKLPRQYWCSVRPSKFIYLTSFGVRAPERTTKSGKIYTHSYNAQTNTLVLSVKSLIISLSMYKH